MTLPYEATERTGSKEHTSVSNCQESSSHLYKRQVSPRWHLLGPCHRLSLLALWPNDKIIPLQEVIAATSRLLTRGKAVGTTGGLGGQPYTWHSRILANIYIFFEIKNYFLSIVPSSPYYTKKLVANQYHTKLYHPELMIFPFRMRIQLSFGHLKHETKRALII